MALDEGAEPPALTFVEPLDEGDAMGVADRDGRHRQAGPVAELERHADDLAVRAVHGDLRRPEGRAAHLDRNEAHPPALDAALTLDDAALGIDREGRLLRAAVVPEILREDPEPVARLLGLTAVGVEDAQAEIGALRGDEQQDAVRPHAPVPIADPPDRLLGERSAQVFLLDHDVVVAEPVALGEGNHGRDSSTRRPAAADTYPA